MADKKISQLTAASTPLAGTEVLPIVQSGSTVKVASDDLTVKNVRSNVTTGILQVAGPGAGTTRTMTVPNANFTAARTDAGQTFSGTQTFSAATNLATSSGDVGIFTSTPDVFGRFYTKTVGMTSNGTTALQINGTTYGAIDLGAGGTRTAGINASATEMQIGSITAIPVYINAGGGTKMYVYSSGGISTDSTDPGAGNVRVGNGNFVVGTAAKGIDFSANTHAAGMTSELLNWYEEGTWTPVLSATTTPPSATYANRTARYTRVGRLVTVSVWMNISSQSGGAGNVIISGLPFTAANTSGANIFAAAIGGYQNIDPGASKVLQAFVGDNSANIVFGTSNQDGSGITQSLPIASVGASNINIMITASYMV